MAMASNSKDGVTVTRIRNLSDFVWMFIDGLGDKIEPELLETAKKQFPRRLGVYDDAPFIDEAEGFMEHNNANSIYRCSQCKKVLPNPHLLDLNVQEDHDSYFSAAAERKPSYRCFVEECTEKFMTSTARFDHAVLVHKFPKDFKFDTKPKKKSQAKKSNDEFVGATSMEIDHKDSERKIDEAHKKKSKGQKKRIDIDSVIKDLKDSLPDEN